MHEHIYKARTDKICYNCNNEIKKGQKYTAVTLFPSDGLYLSNRPIKEPFL